MVILISSAVRSPIAKPYSRRTKAWMWASRSNEPVRTASNATTPPSDNNADSDVPPPMSTTMFPTGSLIGRSAPIAAANGCSINWASAAPERRAASVTARRSTAVIADGTQMSTFGRLKRLTPTRSRSNRTMRWVTSKSVMAPLRSGRTATMCEGVRPIICQASRPIARTSLLRWLMARTDGSASTTPSPRM